MTSKKLESVLDEVRRNFLIVVSRLCHEYANGRASKTEFERILSDLAEISRTVFR
jgi:hypothetical protein